MTKPELSLPLQASAPHQHPSVLYQALPIGWAGCCAPHQQEGVWPLRMLCHETDPIHIHPTGWSSVESGFEPATLRPRSTDLITRPPQPSLEREIRLKCRHSLLTIVQNSQIRLEL
ncbi:hypothetical protein AVEN_23981-1 [Araneus ventricosus]|uniref:Uncharacterized protein n=1 Tax=Araneus ventricosus TaxID=182803 RepID=A0A4Y2D1K6_ARAVE|nr:hypothetical protein AVEN_23981-1 [Araneus ventricosus]